MAPLVIALASLLVGGGGMLAWLKFFHSEAPLTAAQIADLEAGVKVKEAEAAKTVGELLGNALAKVSELAEARRLEIEDLEVRVDDLESWARGDHREWDVAILSRVRERDEDWPDWPPLPLARRKTP